MGFHACNLAALIALFVCLIVCLFVICVLIIQQFLNYDQMFSFSCLPGLVEQPVLSRGQSGMLNDTEQCL